MPVDELSEVLKDQTGAVQVKIPTRKRWLRQRRFGGFKGRDFH